MKNSIKIKRMVGIATLAALVVGLQFLSNYVSFGSISITLALIPIAMGAILYGPIAGAVLGGIMGIIVIVSPSTLAVFMPYNPVATIFLCILKTGLAGLASGFVFKLFAFIARKQNEKKAKMGFFAAGIITATLVVPIINTGLFIAGAWIFFKNVEVGGVLVFGGTFMGIITAVLTTNFFIEFLVSVILSPALVYLIKVLTYQNDLGFTTDFSSFNGVEEDNNKYIDSDIEELEYKV